MTETVVNLKPTSEWRPGMTREQLIGELDVAVTMPGVANIWTQPIINRINMLTTGIRSEVGVKIFGHDLKALEERARMVAEVLRRIPGAVDVYPEQMTGHRTSTSVSTVRRQHGMASRLERSRMSLRRPWARTT